MKDGPVARQRGERVLKEVDGHLVVGGGAGSAPGRLAARNQQPIPVSGVSWPCPFLAYGNRAQNLIYDVRVDSLYLGETLGQMMETLEHHVDAPAKPPALAWRFRRQAAQRPGTRHRTRPARTAQAP